MKSFAQLVGIILIICTTMFALPIKSVMAIETTPNPIDKAIPQQWRDAVGKFLSAMGAANREAALDGTKVVLSGGDRGVIFQVQTQQFCPKDADGCLTVAGRIVSGDFIPNVMFVAGSRMNGSDGVPGVFAADGRFLRFYGKTTIVSLLPTPKGWVVISDKQTDPPM
jgi:hypothetical protein